MSFYQDRHVLQVQHPVTNITFCCSVINSASCMAVEIDSTCGSLAWRAAQQLGESLLACKSTVCKYVRTHQGFCGELACCKCCCQSSEQAVIACSTQCRARLLARKRKEDLHNGSSSFTRTFAWCQTTILGFPRPDQVAYSCVT